MKINLRTALISLALLLALAATQPMHAVAQPAPTSTPAPAPAPAPDKDTAYAAGTHAMNQQQWNDAVADFDQVINAHGNRVDAALYWKAYSLNKLGNNGLALATCFQLRSQFKDSPWVKDCKALGIDLHVSVNAMPDIHIDTDAMNAAINTSVNEEVRASIYKDQKDQLKDKGKDKDSHDPDEDIKMLALNSLLNQDPARAIPMLRGVLTGNQSLEMKRHALFVLAQSKSPEAESILHDAVVGKMDPSLQREAIQSMAVFQGKRANDTLAEVYRTTTDPQVKRAVISALFITQDAPRLVELARNEKDLDLKRDIVRQLAVMHDKAATDYMLELLK